MARENERYEIAKILDGIVTHELLEEEEVNALQSAVAMISPEYLKDKAAAVEAAMNSPEVQARVRETMKTEKAQRMISEHGGTINGRIIRFGGQKKGGKP